MIRIVGGGALLLASALAASHVISLEKKKIEQLETFISLIRHTRERIDSYSMPLEKILKEEKELIVKLGIDKDVPDFSSLLSGCEIICGEESKKILIGFAEELGKGYREREVKLCDTALSGLETIKRRIESEFPSKKRRTIAICFAIGGAIIISLL